MQRQFRPYLLALSFVLSVTAKAVAQQPEPGIFTSIDVPGAERTVALGNNDAGDIVGFCFGDGLNRGYLLRHGQINFIDYPVPGYTTAFGINNAADVVGDYFGAGFH